jgi:hypothetical protein
MHSDLHTKLVEAMHAERCREAPAQLLVPDVETRRALARVLRRARRRSRGAAGLDPGAEVRIWPASTEETIALRQLPSPGGAPPSTATVLVADVNGATAAALSLEAGLIMSATDPPAPELKELLLLRARQLLRAGVADAPVPDQPDAPPSSGRRFGRRTRQPATSRGAGGGA